MTDIGCLVDAFDQETDVLTASMPFSERVGLVVDDADTTFNMTKTEGLLRRAGLRYLMKIGTSYSVVIPRPKINATPKQNN